MKLLKAVGFGVLIEAAAIGILWAAVALQGSRWAALVGLLILPVFGLTAIPRRQRP